jgi:hypothetical protein
MISSITKEVIKGSVKLVQNITYSNGSKVKRILDPVTKLPIEIIQGN